MKKAVIRLLALALVFALAYGISCALADGGDWTCENCGQAGNIGNFCFNCAAPRPDSGEWTCPNCGQAGNKGNFCFNCAAARPGSAETTVSNTQTVDEHLEQIPGETEKVKICVQGAEASAYIDNNGKWVPTHVIDGDQSTCWQVSDKKGLKNRVWIQLNIGSEQTVDEIWIKNGFWGHNTEGLEQYSINSRPKDIRIEFLYSGESSFRDGFTCQLKDEAFTDWQRISLNAHHERVTAVKIWVQSKYNASKKKFIHDICLSEVMLVKYGPASGAKPAAGSKAETLYETRPDISGAKLLEKIATRQGPGTQYAETHTYFGDNWQSQRLPVLKKHFNKQNGVWWVQLEFTYNGVPRRLWTGAKRVDVDLDKVKEDKKRGLVHVEPTKAYAGPGIKYYEQGEVLFFEDEIEWYDRESGFVEIDYYDVNREIQRRVWVPESAVSNWH